MEKNTERKFRTRDRLDIFGARVAVVGESKVISDTVTLCEFKVVLQSGDERYPDTWVTITGSNGLAEKIAGLKKGDRINASGKPYFRTWIRESDNTAHLSVEIRFPEFVDVCSRAEEVEPSAEGEGEEETEVVEEKPVAKRGPGRPKKEDKKPASVKTGRKQLPFVDDDEEDDE